MTSKNLKAFIDLFSKMSEVPIRPTLHLRLLIPAISPANQDISVGTKEVGVSKNRFLSQAKKERGGG